jgi:tRNA A58 N-methylase Trm61
MKDESIKDSKADIQFALWIDNLMSRLKIERLITNIGSHALVISTIEDLNEFLEKSTKGFVFLDLENPSLNLEEIKAPLKKNEGFLERIICFFPHVETHLKNQAKETGLIHVIPRSIIFGDLRTVLKKVVPE